MKIPCPDEERLGDYLEGRLSEEDRSQMEEHLSYCQICLEGLVITNSLMRGRSRFELDPVPADVTEGAVHLVTSQSGITSSSLVEELKRSLKNVGLRISDVFWPKLWGKWHLATIRGSKRVASKNLVSLKVPFKQVETEIEIEKTGGSKALIRLKLPEAHKPRKALRVTLKQGEREVASYLFDGAYVLFENIPFGRYSISLTEDGAGLGAYPFEIKGNAS